MLASMAEIYHLTAHESVTAPQPLPISRGRGLVGCARLGTAAPLHPAQDERFEVLEGELSAVVDGAERSLRPGDTLEIPRGAVHKMWNSSDGLTRATWQTRPAGRTLEWWKAIDDLGRRHPPGVASPTLAAARAAIDPARPQAAGGCAG